MVSPEYIFTQTAAREYLAYLQEEVNPWSGIKELLSNEGVIP